MTLYEKLVTFGKLFITKSQSEVYIQCRWVSLIARASSNNMRNATLSLLRAQNYSFSIHRKLE